MWFFFCQNVASHFQHSSGESFTTFKNCAAAALQGADPETTRDDWGDFDRLFKSKSNIQVTINVPEKWGKIVDAAALNSFTSVWRVD